MTASSDDTRRRHGNDQLPATLTGRFADAVRRWGDRAAVSDDTASLTYGQLDARSAALAATLAGLGVRPEDRVVVFLPRCAELVVALLGVLRCGGCYVAIDAQYPQQRRDLMIGMSGAAVMISGGALLETARAHYGDRLKVIDGPRHDSGPAVAARSSGDQPIRPAGAASVLFTSGSTGIPKGVVIEHRNLVFFATNPGLPALGTDDRTGQISSMSFDAFHYELWVTLLHGAELVILPRAPDLAALGLGRELRGRGITALLVPTMFFNQLALEEPDAFAGLRVLLVGGDVISPAACRAVLRGAFRGQLVNLYGPTEITTACTAFSISPADTAGDIPIGAPLPGAGVYLLPDTGGSGAGAGELVVTGPGVTRGYLGRPDLTAERFVELPGVQGRAYRTGDLARHGHDGMLLFAGRIDDQVKIRGYRVDPREAELALCEHPDVQDVVVRAKGAGEDRYLTAAVVTTQPVEPSDLITFAAARLPHFLVPRTVVAVPSIPVTAHGKRDLERLDAMVREAAAAPAEAAPASVPPAHAVLAELRCGLLDVESVRPDDDFLGLGGHSMLAVRLAKQIQKRFGVLIPPADVIRTTRFADMTRLLEDALPGTGG